MSSFQLYRRLIKDLRPARFYIIAGCLLYIPVTVLNVIQPAIIGYAVQHGMLAPEDRSMTFFAMIFLIAVVLLALCELLQGLALQVAGQILVAHVRQNTFEKAQRLPIGVLDSTPLGHVLTRLTNDPESVAEMFSMGAVQIFGDMLFLMGTFLMLLFVDVTLTFYSALILPILAIGVYWFRKGMRRAYVKVRESMSGLNSFLQEYISGMATVQMSGCMSKTYEDFDRENQKFLLAGRQSILFDAAIYSFVDAISYVACAVVLWGAFRLKLEHALSLGVLVAFIEALSRFFQPVRELSNRYAIFQSAIVSLERIYDLLDWPEEKDKNTVYYHQFRDSIKFNDVSFFYRNGEKALHRVSFDVKKGQRVALVGHSGAGKSTVIKLLNRFYPVDSGSILIDGTNINDLPLSDLRKLISVVPQEVFLFKGSVRENLCFGKQEVADEKLWQALKQTQLADTIKNKGGLDLNILSKGANFSYGERQLLAIARAIVRNPPILVLDEATGNVDAATESRLQAATRALLKDRTALIIAHRISTIKDADKILVFSHGEIIEQGDHEELIKRDGIYANLVRLQAILEHDRQSFMG